MSDLKRNARRKMRENITAQRPRTQMPAYYWEAYQTSKLSDMTISCGGAQGRTTKSFRVHKIVLAMHSNVLEAMAYGDFKEGKSNHIDLPEEDPLVFEAVVHWMYKSCYDVPEERTHDDLAFHAEVYAVADRYEVLEAMQEAEWYYMTVFEKDSETMTMNILSYYDSIRTAYDLSMEDDMILSHLVSFAKLMARSWGLFALAERRTGAQLKEARRELMQEVPQFAIDTCDHLMDHLARDHE